MTAPPGTWRATRPGFPFSVNHSAPSVPVTISHGSDPLLIVTAGSLITAALAGVAGEASASAAEKIQAKVRRVGTPRSSTPEPHH